jgi:predicted CopG family antitoxin
MTTPKNRYAVIKTISLSEETYERLRRTGFAATTFNELVTRLLDMHEDKMKYEQEQEAPLSN